MRLRDTWRDVLLAGRSLKRQPSYALVVILTLALGIAANALIFSFMNPYLIRRLPYSEPERLVQLAQVDPATGYDGVRLSLPQVEDWRQRSRAFEDVGAYYYGTRNLTGSEGAEQIVAGIVTANLFDVLGVSARLGRTFHSGEGGPGGADVVVLRHGLWQRRFAGDPKILGTSILIDGAPYTVVGVMGPEFNFPFGGVRLWLPAREAPAAEPRTRTVFLPVARLAPGATEEQAQAELLAIQRDLGALFPDADGAYRGVSVEPLRQALNFAYDVMVAAFTVLLAAVALVLLIACANVASLTMARSSAKRREVALRAALGAGRSRLVQELLTESFLLALIGGAAGVGIATAAVRYLGPLIPEDIFRVGEFTLDLNVLSFSAAVTLATPILFGLLPALGLSRLDLSRALSEARAGGSSLRTRRLLVVGEIAMAVALIAGTGLMLRSFLALQQVDLGFRPERVLTVMVDPPGIAYPDAASVDGYYDRAEAALENLPGVTGVGLVQPLPMNHETWDLAFARPGLEPAPSEPWPRAHAFHVSPGYLEVMGVRRLAGRELRETDREGAPPVVLVSQSLAAAHWPEGNPVGQTLRIGGPDEPTAATVVGVIADVRHEGYENRAPFQIYRPLAQRPLTSRFIVVSAAGDPGALAVSVRSALAGVDPNLPLGVRTMEAVVSESALQWSIGSLLLGVFGAAALLLAGLGIYGVVAYAVSERRREIGIRMALGATVGEIRAVVVGDGLRLTLYGIGLGLLIALGLGQAMASVLFGVSAVDPVSLGAAAGLFFVTAFVSSLVPATSAAKTNPVSVLRYD